MAPDCCVLPNSPPLCCPVFAFAFPNSPPLGCCADDPKSPPLVPPACVLVLAEPKSPPPVFVADCAVLPKSEPPVAGAVLEVPKPPPNSPPVVPCCCCCCWDCVLPNPPNADILARVWREGDERERTGRGDQALQQPQHETGVEALLSARTRRTSGLLALVTAVAGINAWALF